MNLNLENWQDFHLYDIFSISGGNKLDKCKMTFSCPSINFVGRSSDNNGVTAFVDEIYGVQPYNAGDLSLALGGEYLGSCFIQQEPFYTSQNVAVLTPLFEMSTKVKLFIAHIIRFESSNRYKAFARELNAHIKNDFTIKLPTTVEGLLDTEFIDKYMSSFDYDISTIPDYFLNEGYKKARWYLDNIDIEQFEQKYSGIKKQQNIKLSDRKWEQFCLGNTDYFLIERGEAGIYLKDLDDGDIPYISTSTENNGITAYKNVCNRDGNLITLAYDGSIGTCFYQTQPFFASEKIVTINTAEVKLNKYIAMFLIPILQLEAEMYSYGGRKWTVNEQLLKTEIKLPVDDNGNPDWQFMEDYIKSLPFSSNL